MRRFARKEYVVRPLRFLVSAGPTREYIDPVRFISNPSTGMMGYAVAKEALAAGHRVDLVTGPVALPPVPGARMTRVVTAEEMRRAMLRHLDACDVVVMTAAVGDYRPARRLGRKMHKAASTLRLTLVRTPDILQAVRARARHQVLIGFAAETHDVKASAARKLAHKGLDMIVANDVGHDDAGFGRAAVRACALYRDGRCDDLGLCPKRRAARYIVRAAERMAGGKAGT